MSQLTPLLSARQSLEVDRLAQKQYHLNSEILMEVAGAVSAQDIIDHYKSARLIVVLCGPGHNGGDGLVVARHLSSSGKRVKVFFTSSASQLVQKQKERLKNLSVDLESFQNIAGWKSGLLEADVVVDALFGVGLSKSVEGVYREVIEQINSLNKLVVSLDTPSGLDVDTGRIKGLAVKASRTLSFGLAKPGFFLMDGPELVAQLKVFSIGFPETLLKEKADKYFLITRSWVAKHLPKRKATDHKACQGHLLVLAGCPGFWGAGQLASVSAYRMGVGYVTWAGNTRNQKQEMVFPLKVDSSFEKNNLSPETLTADLNKVNLLDKKTAVLIGPGFGLDNKEAKKWLLQLKQSCLPVVVDADAFSTCIKESLFPLPSHWVVTPHSGELGRLFGVSGKEVDTDRLGYAMKASQITGCLVLLKGFYSVIAHSSKCWIIPTGNSALAKAGTGDVLAGFIGALLARSLDAFSATAVAGYVHGLLALKWEEQAKDKDSLMAYDLKDILPVVLRELRDFADV